MVGLKATSNPGGHIWRGQRGQAQWVPALSDRGHCPSGGLALLGPHGYRSTLFLEHVRLRARRAWCFLCRRWIPVMEQGADPPLAISLTKGLFWNPRPRDCGGCARVSGWVGGSLVA